jgi:hypothetical protein
MATALWLAGPYLSMLVLCRWQRVARCVADHTATTLLVGWVAVLALAAAMLGLWNPPVAVLAVCAVLSGLAVMTPGPGRWDDGPGPDADDEPPPSIDWERFDDWRRGWDPDRRGRTSRSRGPTSTPPRVPAR